MYRLTINPDIIQRISDDALIPVNLGNHDYNEYLKWVDSGGVIEPIRVVEQMPPNKVTFRQACLSLLNHGYYPIVKNYIETLGGVDGDRARIEWTTSTVVERDSWLVNNIQTLLGLTDEQLDQLFFDAQNL